MILTINQPDSKCVLAIIVAAFSFPCAAKCPENHYKVQELCCLNCQEGEYVVRNCSDGPSGHNGGLCKTCRRCEEHEITISHCTQFSDTQCAIDMHIKEHQITLFGCSSVIAAVVMLAVIVSVCFFWRIRKSSESDGSSAGEPFNVSV